jgi:hypothetical protein
LEKAGSWFNALKSCLAGAISNGGHYDSNGAENPNPENVSLRSGAGMPW